MCLPRQDPLEVRKAENWDIRSVSEEGGGQEQKPQR
jgi:hypothetical protein